MLLSIIIPVYNIEKYIGRCIESILACNIAESEIILVIGDSSDGSNEICAAYARSCLNIRVLVQNGIGLSNARNCALRIAQGTYVVYVDGDDYMDGMLFSELIEEIRNDEYKADLVVTDYRRINASTGVVENIYQIGADTPPQHSMEYLPRMLNRKQCFWNVWRYIYKRSYLEINGIEFCENMLSEDIEYTTKVLLGKPNVLFIHCPYYNYFVGRGDSLMDCPTYKRLKDTVEIICASIRMVKDSTFEYSQILIEQFQFEYILNIAIGCEIDKADRHKAYWLYKDSVDILCVGSSKIAHLFHRILCILPFSFVSYSLHLLKICKRYFKMINFKSTWREKIK